MKPLSISEQSFESYKELWQKTHRHLSWQCPFILPFWLETTWRHFGDDGDPIIFTASEGQDMVGIVPLVVQRNTACFMGVHHVCDYQDMAVRPDAAVSVTSSLLDHLKTRGIDTVVLRTLHPNAHIMRALSALADAGANEIRWAPDEVTFETGLPGDWDGYLLQLNGKQRHEVRRKIRRLESDGPFSYRLAASMETMDRDIEIFLDLFRKNRQDKARFMDESMEAYFTDLMMALARGGMLRLGFLEVGNQPAATVLCFDYQGTRYLYNSGYDKQFDDLSVGILSKVFSIRHAIDTGLKYYDFLKGEEVYKGRIGGNQIPLSQCSVTL